MQVLKRRVKFFENNCSIYLIQNHFTGGTLDIAAHDISSSQTIEEIVCPDGGPWGGENVNLNFEQFLVGISGAEAFVKFKKKYLEDYLDLQIVFERKKRLFPVERSDGTLTVDSVKIQLPSSFVKLHKKDNGEKLDKSLLQTEFNTLVSFKGGRLVIDKDVFETFFKETVNNIVEKVRQVLRNIGKSVPYIFCVGGFSELKIVKKALCEAFSDTHTVIFPRDAITAIMKGAVILARDESIISKRKSRYTIGLDWNVPFDPKNHPKSKLEFVEDGALCTDVFRTVVKEGDDVVTGVPVHEVKSYVKTVDQKVLDFPFYRSYILKNPMFVDDTGCVLMGRMTVPLGDTKEGLERYVCLKVFLDKLLHAEAVDNEGVVHRVALKLEDF